MRIERDEVEIYSTTCATFWQTLGGCSGAEKEPSAEGIVNVALEDMLTLLAQVEICFNYHSFTSMPNDPSDFEVLTPGHFLTGSNLQGILEVDTKEVADNHLSNWELT